MSGVRIKLPTLPFIENTLTHKYINNGNPFTTYYPKEFFDFQHLCPYLTMPFCRKVQYTNDETKICTQDHLSFESLINGKGKGVTANFMDIGKYKRQCWSFQSEWRYCMFFIPVDIETGHMFIDTSSTSINTGFDYYDLAIDERALEQIEITLGPRIGDKAQMVYKIVNKYYPKAKIVHSKLKIN